LVNLGHSHPIQLDAGSAVEYYCGRGQIRKELAMHYRLQVLNLATGTIDGEWILQLPAVVGRTPEADVQIGDPSISRRHCQFFLNGEGALSVRDFDSMNGTYIDDRKVSRAVLKPGDIVRAGSVSLKLEWTDEELTEKPTVGKPSVDTTQPMRIITKDDLR
jgi:pSer/pThr/pTyr-binding forkhead associated (FHA) protein